jgi:hypothetical protein
MRRLYDLAPFVGFVSQEPTEGMLTLPGLAFASSANQGTAHGAASIDAVRPNPNRRMSNVIARSVSNSKLPIAPTDSM